MFVPPFSNALEDMAKRSVTNIVEQCRCKNSLTLSVIEQFVTANSLQLVDGPARKMIDTRECVKRLCSAPG